MSIVEIIIVVCVLGSLIANYILERNLTRRIERLERRVSIGASCEDTMLNTEDTLDYLKRIGIDYDGDTTKQKMDEASLNGIESVRNPAKLYDAVSTVQKAGIDIDGDRKKISREAIENIISQIDGTSEIYAGDWLSEVGFTERNRHLIGSGYPIYYSRRFWSDGENTISIDIKNGHVVRAVVE